LPATFTVTERRQRDKTLVRHPREGSQSRRRKGRAHLAN
jgi:hypothetical protein